MTNEIVRTYGCKDEELIFSCGFAASSMERDLLEFSAFSPKMNQGFLTGFKAKITTATDVVMPKSLMIEKKEITARLYAGMDGLLEPIRRLGGYISLAKSAISLSATDFGLTVLRAAISSKDAEGVFKSLQLVIANIAKYKAVLAEQGLTDDFAAGFVLAATSIADDKQSQYEIETKRKGLLQANIGLMNELYADLIDLLSVGKILYKGKDPVKQKEYTFTELLKNVRRASTAKTTTNAASDTTAAK